MINFFFVQSASIHKHHWIVQQDFSSENTPFCNLKDAVSAAVHILSFNFALIKTQNKQSFTLQLISKYST